MKKVAAIPDIGRVATKRATAIIAPPIAATKASISFPPSHLYQYLILSKALVIAVPIYAKPSPINSKSGQLFFKSTNQLIRLAFQSSILR